MTTNTHLERAVSRLHNGTTNEVARAQAEATLALAYEQRTANLIAIFAQDNISDLNYGYALTQIKERLGL